MFDRFASIFLRFLSALLQVLPVEWTFAAGRFFGGAMFYFNRRSALAYVNLKAAFGERYTARERKQIVRDHFRHLGQNVVEMLTFPKMDQHYFDRHIAFDKPPAFYDVLHGARGVIFITPHFGNWEMTHIFFSSFLSQPVYLLVRRQKHSRLNSFLDELRTSHGFRAIYKEEGGVRDLIRTLKKNGLVGVLGDLSGGREGRVVRFFGRKTTAPDGFFRIARSTGTRILPVFMVRENGPRHHFHMGEPFWVDPSKDEQTAVQEMMDHYYGLLEQWIRKYPAQWFWVYQRWKHCFTKRVLILQDGRAGHTNQSEAVKRELERIARDLGDPYEFDFQSVDVRFKSPWHQKLFSVFAPFFLPFTQGRMDVLHFFLEPGCATILSQAHADLVVSAGAGLVPLNLMLKVENTAKSIVLMKPPFPYHHRQFDLLVIPAHDHFSHTGRHVLRTLVAPNRVDETLLQASGEELKRALLGRTNGTRRISVFIGGSSKSYRFEPEQFHHWLQMLKQSAAEEHWELLITTSRRTDPGIEQLVKAEFAHDPACKLLVIANESNRDGVTYGMLALSDTAIVTEDSISMVSEAVSAGKNVLVMRLGNGRLAAKHARFHETLRTHDLTRVADASNFRTQLAQATNAGAAPDLKANESKKLGEALRGLL